MSEEDAYGGLLGAFPYAVRRSGSWTFRAYAVLAGVLGALLVVFVGLALVVWVAATVGAPASVTLSRAFLLVIGLALFAPLVAPVLLVARRHRRAGADGRYDAALGACGFLFLLSCYVGLLVLVPESARGEPAGPLAPVVLALYDLPRAAAAGPPLAVLALMALVSRVVGRASDGGEGGEPTGTPDDETTTETATDRGR